MPRQTSYFGNVNKLLANIFLRLTVCDISPVLNLALLFYESITLSLFNENQNINKCQDNKIFNTTKYSEIILNLPKTKNNSMKGLANRYYCLVLISHFYSRQKRPEARIIDEAYNKNYFSISKITVHRSFHV